MKKAFTMIEVIIFIVIINIIIVIVSSENFNLKPITNFANIIREEIGAPKESLNLDEITYNELKAENIELRQKLESCRKASQIEHVELPEPTTPEIKQFIPNDNFGTGY